jgi:hypothetical protein
MVLRIVGIAIAALVGLWLLGQVMQFIVAAVVVVAVLAAAVGGYRMIRNRSQRSIGS